MGVVAASALAYPVLFSAVQLVVAQLVTVDVAAVVIWLAVASVCCVALVAAVRWGAERRVLRAWLLRGLAQPVLFELWLVWPRLAA